MFNRAWRSSYALLRGRLDGSTEEFTVGDVLRRKSGELPDLVHTHPSETVRDAIGILREYGVSQMPVVGADPRGGPGAPGDAGRGRRQRVRTRATVGRLRGPGQAGRRRRAAHEPAAAD